MENTLTFLSEEMMNETQDSTALLTKKDKLLASLKKFKQRLVAQNVRDGRNPPIELSFDRRNIKSKLEEVVDLGLIDDPVFWPFVQEFGRPLAKAEREEEARKSAEAYQDFAEMLHGGPVNPDERQLACLQLLEALKQYRNTLRHKIELSYLRDEWSKDAEKLSCTGKDLMRVLLEAKELKLRNNPLVKALALEYKIALK